jgi:hypothetical protein
MQLAFKLYEQWLNLPYAGRWIPCQELVVWSPQLQDRPTRSKFSVVLLGPRANAEFVPKFHVALNASLAALPMVTLKILPYTNVTLTLTLGWTTLFMGDRGEGAQHKKERK